VVGLDLAARRHQGHALTERRQRTGQAADGSGRTPLRIRSDFSRYVKKIHLPRILDREPSTVNRIADAPGDQFGQKGPAVTVVRTGKETAPAGAP
jgi:hypothetical protein